MRIEPLSEDVEVFVGETYSSNATLFHAPEGTLVIDALASRVDAERLREHVEKERRSHVRCFVITHGFSDHMAALSHFPGVPVVTHVEVERTFKRELFRSDEEAGYWVEPHLRVRAPTELRWGKHWLRLEPLGGHTESTLGIDAPSLDTVFLGDTAVGPIVYVRYAHLARLRIALEWGRARRRSRVILGHGGIHSAITLEHALHYLDAYQLAANSNVPVPESGVPIREWLAQGAESSAFIETFHARNLEMLREAQRSATR
jgi:glyoxylase-like metal-dependent hydrolase (beta-lactamase superfamily II)